MQSVTRETRREAYILRPVTRQDQILKVMGDRAMTARQIARELGFTDLNAVKPRLTELSHEGKILATDKVMDETTGRKVVLWQATEVAE